MLFATWRRFNRRMSEQRRHVTHEPDLWQEGGDRLTRKLDLEARPDEDDADEDLDGNTETP